MTEDLSDTQKVTVTDQIRGATSRTNIEKNDLESEKSIENSKLTLNTKNMKVIMNKKDQNEVVMPKHTYAPHLENAMKQLLNKKQKFIPLFKESEIKVSSGMIEQPRTIIDLNHQFEELGNFAKFDEQISLKISNSPKLPPFNHQLIT